MKKVHHLVVKGFCWLAGAFWGFSALAQKEPNVCVNPPAPYKKGGDFVIKYQVGSLADYVTEICVPADGLPVFFEPVNSEPSLREVKYLYDVQDDNMIPLPEALALVNRVGISVADTGTYWIMQLAYNANKEPVAQCRAIQIKTPAQSPVLTANTASTDELGKIIVVLQPNNYSSPYRLFQDGKLLVEDDATSYEFPAPDEKPECFTVSYLGECQQWTPPSAPFCVPWLEWDPVQMLLTWQMPTDTDKTVSVLFAITEFGLHEIVCEDCKQPYALDLQWLNRNIQFVVLVEIFREESAVGSWSNHIRLPPIPIPVFPTIFTRNDDGWNDEFQGIFPGPVRPQKIQILNREGQILREMDEPWRWDGKTQAGIDVAPGYFICRILYKVRDYEFVYTQSFQLVR